jgi:hypothetical protein
MLLVAAAELEEWVKILLLLTLVVVVALEFLSPIGQFPLVMEQQTHVHLLADGLLEVVEVEETLMLDQPHMEVAVV